MEVRQQALRLNLAELDVVIAATERELNRLLDAGQPLVGADPSNPSDAERADAALAKLRAQREDALR